MNTATVETTSPARTTLMLRTLDAADRAHARVATRLHDARNNLLTSATRGIERVEHILQRARDGLTRIDSASADVVNRAQSLVGAAIEKARARAS